MTKARTTLEHGRLMLTVALTEDAGRCAYLASYQAAQALIFERTGKIARTHKGVQVEFARLAVKEPRIDLELRRFLPQAYYLKAVCDYEVGLDATVPFETADAAIRTAARFIECITGVIVESV